MTEKHGLDSPPYEELEVCPACYGICILEAKPCGCCGEYVTGAYIQTEAGDVICDSCYVVKDALDGG